jgi:hypothetical protein
MSMRLYSKADFEAELRKYGLSPTEHKTDILTLWVSDKGMSIFVPHDQDMYPDYMLDTILAMMNRLYDPSVSGVTRCFTVKPKE